MSSVGWSTYSRLLRILAVTRPGARTTYDRGELEIMSPTTEHEIVGNLLGRFVTVLTEEFKLPILQGGSSTLRRRKLKCGLEPDRCFWIANEAKVRGVKRLNLRIHPPPDLAIEVDVTRSSLNRMQIYAKLAVPEVWRLDAAALTFLSLQPNGKYASASHSLAFHHVTPADLLRFLVLWETTEQNEIVARFRQWVQSVKP
jgi:Uma2 family endonuclease